MKEIKEIITAFDKAQILGEQTALATVVKVDGSSYRRPGARMLVTENGALTGAISGGCLEGDALKKAQLVIFQKKSMVVTYDTTDDDDSKFGVGLGCNGIIHILIEPIDPEAANHPIALLKQAMETREPKVLVTLFDLKNKREKQLGTCLLFTNGHFSSVPATVRPWLQEIERNITDVLNLNQSIISEFVGSQPINAFVELVHAPISLVVVGAGNDAMPLCKLADVLGWEVTLIDGRSNHATAGRFPTVHQIHVATATEALPLFTKDDRTAVVLMTHNFNYDLAIMEGLLPLQIPYLGVLGPKKKLEKMLGNLEKNGVRVGPDDLKKIYGPIGLHIGAEAPEEIALSIVSEVKTVLGGGDARFLRDREGPIHVDF